MVKKYKSRSAWIKACEKAGATNFHQSIGMRGEGGDNIRAVHTSERNPASGMSVVTPIGKFWMNKKRGELYTDVVIK